MKILNNQDLLKKWESSGLLDKLSDDEKLIYAQKFEEAADYLLNDLFAYDTGSEYLFPALKKILNFDNKVDVMDIIKKFKKYHQENFVNEYVGTKNYNTLYEEEFVEDFVDDWKNNKL